MKTPLFILVAGACCIALTSLFSFRWIEESKAFFSPKQDIGITLPQKWLLKNIEHKDSVLMLISPHKNPVDTTSMKVRIKKKYGIIKNLEESRAWIDSLYALQQNSQGEFMKQEINAEPIKKGNYIGIFADYEWQQQQTMPLMRRYIVVLADEKNLIEIQMDSPEAEWDTMLEVYQKAIKTLQIK